MKRSWTLPKVLLAILTGLLAIAGYPNRIGAQGPLPETRRLFDALPVSAPNLPAVVGQVAVGGGGTQEDASANTTLIISSIQETVNGNGIHWTNISAPVRLLNKTFNLNGSGWRKGQIIKTKVGGEEVTHDVKNNPWSVTIELRDDAPMQVVQIQLFESVMATIAKKTATVTVTPPNPDPATKPSIESVSNQKYFNGYVNTSPTKKIDIFERFMGIKVKPAPGFDDLEVQFFMRQGDGKYYALDTRGMSNVKKNERIAGGKEVHVDLPDVFDISTPETEHFALIRANKGETVHSYSSANVTFNVKHYDQLVAPTISDVKADDIKLKLDPHVKAYPHNGDTINIEGTWQKLTGAGLVIFRNDSTIPETLTPELIDPNKWSFVVNNLTVHSQTYFVAVAQGDKIGPRSKVRVFVRNIPPRADSVDPEDFGSRPNKDTITVQFDRGTILRDDDSGTSPGRYTVKAGFTLFPKGATTDDQLTAAKLDDSGTAVILTTKTLSPGYYTLTVNRGIKDIFGNESTKPKTFNILMPIGSDLPSVAPGLAERTGPYVPFKEYTKPRTKPEGFNPGDHVETRVVRLYYFRDAHRVAQILNRDAKSWNRIAVDTRRRLFDQARAEAENQSLRRKVFERDAVQASQETRVQEHRLKEAQEQLLNADRRRAEYESQMKGLRAFSSTLAADDKQKLAVDNAAREAEAKLFEANGDIEKARSRVNEARGALQGAQTAESQKRESWQASLELEDKMKADQFRLGVAAMHEDPDTYAPGVPKSNDPVQQVSISVLGESEIHLRGPISGINIIREMINQIDAPTGQVRIAIHTVQINGERQDKMECVSADIQAYIDQSRFLTQQSSLLLRKAVFKVATQKAWMARQVGPFDSQEDRDERYLHSFFGKDFISDLKTQNSEFLRSGNKLLSLNSMDTTSLASTLFILALAKNDTRQEILAEFKQMLATELPMMEQSFFEAGGVRTKATHLNFGCFPKKACYELMAGNARFQSLFGFFDVDVPGSPDTLTPVQREFLKLAQILKSRLVTELEFKQRVMERALVEDRGGGNYLKELKKAADDERTANATLASSQKNVREKQTQASNAALKMFAILSGIRGDQELLSGFNQDLDEDSLWPPLTIGKRGTGKAELTLRSGPPGQLNNRVVIATRKIGEKGEMRLQLEGISAKLAKKWGEDMIAYYTEKQLLLEKSNLSLQKTTEYRFRLAVDALETFKKEINKADATFDFDFDNFRQIQKLQKHSFSDAASNVKFYVDNLRELVAIMNADRVQTQKAFLLWKRLSDAKDYVADSDWKKGITDASKEVEDSFIYLLNAEGERRVATQSADLSRRPLDHKKMLDMLIDEIHDKFVELLEGTRAYTANIDDYIKRVATALDDDFNTQFYQPAFRRVRTTATSWDVSLGAVETTSILTNNRTYAKVDPQATMEFDLPRRNIVITEAFQATKGLIDTYGALMQDPTFLNLTRISAGMPTSTQTLGSNTGVPAIRSVLPGMSRLTDESVMAQSGTGAKSFGTPLDALVPDPAIYKFETGTAYEIRPVIAPDGQSVNFHFNYMYSTNIREPVRADEKHLGRVKRHYIDTNVQLGNYELREISKYQVALRAARTGKGVPLLQDIPGVGVLFRPLPSAESSLQQNVILGQSTIFPTLFDLMGLRWAPSVADLDPLALDNANFIVRQRKQFLTNRVFDYSSSRVDEALQIPDGERRGDLYRSQQTVPYMHPNGYKGPGMGLRDSQLRENYDPKDYYPPSTFSPGFSGEGRVKPHGPTIPGMPYYHDGHMPPQGHILPGAPNYNYNRPAPEGMKYPQSTLPQVIPAPSKQTFPPIPKEVRPPQGMSSNSTSLFATDRLSAVGPAVPSPVPTVERVGAFSAPIPVAQPAPMPVAQQAPLPTVSTPVPPRTIWSKMFGTR